MSKFQNSRLHVAVALLSLSLISTACATSEASKSEFFGRVDPPEGQVLRYISGSEPESLDPQVGTGQPEARVYMALYEGLAEYHPKTMEPIPAIAERWDVNQDSSEFVFHLRKNAKFSNGDPITAHDFVYTFRRGLSPELAARNAYLSYYIKYAQGYNEGGAFVRDPQTGRFLSADEVKPAAAKAAPAPAAVAAAPATPATQGATASSPAESASAQTNATGEDAALDTPFHRYIHEPTRLVVPVDDKGKEKAFKANPNLKAAIEGKELVPIRAEDIGVEAIDDYTFRVTLTQPAPFFIGLIPHQFYRAVPRKAIERFGNQWAMPGRLVSSGPFKLESWSPYSEVVVVKDPVYWDAARVKLQKIKFYPFEEATTMMNMYKAGEVDATYNHTVPVGWLDMIRPLKDYMDAPEVAIEYYSISVLKPPMNDRRVRKAFNMSIDKQALSAWRRTTKPLTAFTPEGIFPGYPQPKGDEFNPERAKQLLAEAGYKDGSGKFDPKKFPVNEVELYYNTTETNRQVAEFVQAQWKQNLGLTIPLKNMEWKTFLNYRSKVEFKGFARNGWVGDYMDPITFLNLFYTEAGESGTGWHDPKFDQMIDAANRELDPAKRFELLAKAEAYLLEDQPVIPLQTQATNWLKKPYVKGLYPNPGTLHAWKYVYIEYDQARWDRGVPDLKVVKGQDEYAE